MKNKFVLAISAISLIFAGNAKSAEKEAEQNWAQWRGPQANGTSATANPPTTWSETSNIKWKVKIPGIGSSTPIIWNNFVFVQTAVPSANKSANSHQSRAILAGQRGGGRGGMSVAPTGSFKFILMCLDRKTGKTLWQKTVREEVPHEGHHPDHGFASHSPITDGKHVISYFGSHGLYCFDMKGNLKWKKDLGKMQTRNAFGEGNSPALLGDTVVVKWDHEGTDDFIVAFDKNNGQQKWRQPRDESTSWSSPLIVQYGGKNQVVASATNKIRSYDLVTGKQIWECAGMTSNTIPTPVTGNNMLYAISGFRGNALLAIKLGKQGDLTGTDAIAWTHNRSTPYVPSPLLYGDNLYFFANNNGILSCFDAKSGKPILNAERIEGLPGVYASPVGAGGKVYLIGRNGTVVVIKRSAKLEILATNKLDERFDASPALAGKELFLRGQEYLYCIAQK